MIRVSIRDSRKSTEKQSCSWIAKHKVFYRLNHGLYYGGSDKYSAMFYNGESDDESHQEQL
jgi:hypothetical protein